MPLGSSMHPHSWQGQEPQHRIYPGTLPCPVGTTPGDRRGSGHTRELSLLLRNDDCPRWATPGQPWAPAAVRVSGERCTSTSAPPAARGCPNCLRAPIPPAGTTTRSVHRGLRLREGGPAPPGPSPELGVVDQRAQGSGEGGPVALQPRRAGSGHGRPRGARGGRRSGRQGRRRRLRDGGSESGGCGLWAGRAGRGEGGSQHAALSGPAQR